MALYFPSSLKLQYLGVPLSLFSAVIFPSLLLCQTPFWVLSLSQDTEALTQFIHVTYCWLSLKIGAVCFGLLCFTRTH